MSAHPWERPFFPILLYVTVVDVVSLAPQSFICSVVVLRLNRCVCQLSLLLVIKLRKLNRLSPSGVRMLSSLCQR